MGYGFKQKDNIIEGRSKNYWVKINKKKDDTGEYFDVLIGKKREENHAHFSLRAFQKPHFFKARGRIRNKEFKIFNNKTNKFVLEKSEIIKEGKNSNGTKITFVMYHNPKEKKTFLSKIEIEEKK